jgi:hypothetical protein
MGFAGVTAMDCRVTAVKFAVAFPLLTVTSCDNGENTTPGLLGVTV